MSSHISYRKQILLGIIVVVLILGVLEAFANVWWYSINTCEFETSEVYAHLDDKAKRVLCLENYNIQFTENRITPVSGSSINVNDKGFRGPEFSPQKPENTYRIFVVGGSTTFGTGVTDEQTAPAFLQKKFDSAELGFNVEVINGGIASSWSLIELEMVKDRIFDFQPDLLIIYDGWNDLDRFTGSLNPGAAPEFWKERWMEICDISKDRGVETIVTLQPFLGTGNRLLTDEEYSRYFEDRLKLDEYYKEYELYVSTLDELNAHCSKTADLRGIFDSISEPIFWDLVHVGAKGNEIIAQNLFELSLPIILENTELLANTNEIQSLIEPENEDEKPNFEQIIPFYKTPVVISYLLADPDKLFNRETTDISELNFKGQVLHGRDFSNENLENAIFYFSALYDVTFKNTNLAKADFRFAKLTNANFEDAMLKDSKFSRTVLTNTVFKGVDLSYTSFAGSEIKNTDFTDTNLQNANFVGANIDAPDITNANLVNADFTRTFIKNVDFTKSKTIDGATFANSKLYNVRFEGMNLSSVSLSNADLTATNLANTDLRKTELQNADFSPKMLDTKLVGGAKISGSNLANKDLTEVVFSRFHTGEEFNPDKINLLTTYYYDEKEGERVFVYTPDVTLDTLKKLATSLSGTNLSNVNLSGKNISNEKGYLLYDPNKEVRRNDNLVAVDFSHANLSNANLTNSDLSYANLSNANLSGAILIGTNLNGADLSGANLEGAILDCINHPVCN